jgi:hypothetical protein
VLLAAWREGGGEPALLALLPQAGQADLERFLLRLAGLIQPQPRQVRTTETLVMVKKDFRLFVAHPVVLFALLPEFAFEVR